MSVSNQTGGQTDAKQAQDRKVVAFLGLGIMGAAMVGNLHKNRHQVKGWNRTAGRPQVEALKELKIEICQSAEEAVADADIICSCVGDEADVEQLLLGPVRKSAKPNALIIDFTTIGKEAAVKISRQLAEAGLRFLDAPVTGGDTGARNGTLTIMVGGEKADFTEALPVLEAVGKKIAWCGSAGSGQALKLCNQVLCAVNLIAVSESLKLAEDLGVDPLLLVDVLGAGAGGSWSLMNLGPRIAEGDWKPGFPIEHMLKDLRLIGENTDCKLPGTHLAQRLFEQAAAHSNSENRLGTQAMFHSYSGTSQET